MEKSDLTKKRIAEQFKKLFTSNPHDKLSVQSIAESIGLSRKTFYYHFPDKSQLIEWIFRFEFAQCLIEACPENELVRPSAFPHDPFKKLPYYCRNAVGIRSLDCSLFFKTLGLYLQENRKYYRYILTGDSASILIRYVMRLYHQALVEDIHFILGRRQMPLETVELLATYFASASINQYFQALIYTDMDLRALHSDDFANLTHDSLKNAIEGYFSRDEHKYSFFAHTGTSPVARI